MFNCCSSSSQRYPIGVFEPAEEITKSLLTKYINDLNSIPSNLKESIDKLNEEQLNYSYRLDGWTVTQVVHHLADTHMNAYIRFKLALTESNPLVKTYDEVQWAELFDGVSAPIDTSVAIITGLHKRWGILIDSLTEQQLKRNFNHPVSGSSPIERLIEFYSWHGNHHIAHINLIVEKK
ncbi:metal-dependent hydrolase [Desulfuribacillus stibiiarsenatis]|uniref:Metal-dependent hydrolase n=1 Tax=Desulfuribacillus stibiiarsenatis TaxID=1390249 RepID=A0A1E5L1Z2_9FIRM|nr:putative metal-dependent hydrolase [Desulfuribacillus stibiiarsenatis]OEH84140.1 metal-dependent hydrolase [Desulfuribacillus stibiiarsenatis]